MVLGQQLEATQQEVIDLRRAIEQIHRDTQEDIRDAVAEARWQERDRNEDGF